MLLLCTRKRTKDEKEACRKIRNVSLRFGPRSWPTTDRLAVKKSLTPQTVRETPRSIIHSFIQSANQSTNQFHLVQVHSNARPVGPGTDATRDPNQTSSTAPTSNAARVRTIVSRCRGRLTFLSAYPHLQIRSINGPTSVPPRTPPFTRGCGGPSCAPEMDIINYSSPWDFSPRLLRGPPYFGILGGWATAVNRMSK